MTVGQSFLYRYSPKNKYHLYIIVIEHEPGRFIAFSITSIREDLEEDRSCVLQPGDHEFIKHESRVYYEKPIPVTETTTALKDLYKEKPPVSEELVSRILEGARVSPSLPKRFRKILFGEDGS